MWNFKLKRVTIKSPHPKHTRRTIENQYPKLYPSASKGFNPGGTYLCANSFCIKASAPYLIGDKYCNHKIQSIELSKLAKNPPINIRGIINTGTNKTAVSVLLKRDDIKNP